MDILEKNKPRVGGGHPGEIDAKSSVIFIWNMSLQIEENGGFSLYIQYSR